MTESVRAEAQPSQPASVAVDPQPITLVTPSGNAYLVLRSSPEGGAEGGLEWQVVYLAGGETAELTRPDAATRLASSASDLVDAFGTLADVAQVGRICVTAVFGKPGGAAAVDRRRFTRYGAGWHLDGAGQRAAAQLPAVPAEIVRDRGEEVSARDAAAGFISDVDRADYDSAWTKTSAIVKAAMSRVDFQRRVDALPRSEASGAAQLYVSFPVPIERFLPGAIMMAWVARATADGPGVEMLVLRLDDDMQWRVAGVVELTKANAPSAIRAYAGAAASSR